MPVNMMCVRHVGVGVADGLVPVLMAVGAIGHHIMPMIVVAIVVPVSLLMFQLLMRMLMPAGFGQMNDDTQQHEHHAGRHPPFC